MSTRRELVAEEVVRLKSEAEVLQRDWRRIPFLGVLGFLAVPAYFVWGPLAGIAVVLMVPALLLTATYLIGVRRAENRQSIDELERQLEDSK